MSPCLKHTHINQQQFQHFNLQTSRLTHTLNTDGAPAHIGLCILRTLGVRPTPGSTAALIPVKKKKKKTGKHNRDGPSAAPYGACVCAARKRRVFTDTLTQLRISLHFLGWMGLLRARPSQPHLLLCLGISQYLLTRCIRASDSLAQFSVCVRHMFWKCGHPSPFV